MKKFVFFQKWTKSPDMRSARLCVTRKEVISQQAFGAQGQAKFIAREGREVCNTNHGKWYIFERLNHSNLCHLHLKLSK